MAAAYKSLKEDFVSNLTGGSISEINYVTAVAPSAYILWSILQSRQSFFTSQTRLTLAVDFLINVGAILLATTLYSSHPLLLNILLLSPAILVYLLPRQSPKSKKVKPPVSQIGSQPSETLNALPLKPFLTTYRGCMMIITCLSILAVDFKIFPRRFAKVENWGTSLMDLGVGSFVFSAGLVAARPVLKEQLAGEKTGFVPRLYKSLRHSLPLFILGLIRLYSVKGLDLAEHVTEYGVHWNFFFTLAVLPPFVAAVQSAFQLIPSFAALAIMLGSLYQLSLEFTDLKAFILTAPRTNLISQNREGIFSFFGYLSIFLAGQATGMYVIPRRLTTDLAQRTMLLRTLAAWSCIWTVLYLLATSFTWGLGLVVSRRLANLPYFLWISAFNCFQITAFCLVETIFFPSFSEATNSKEEKASYDLATSKVIAAFNRNGLAVFLVANPLTGLVNLTVPTLHVGDAQAMGILLGYAAVLASFAVLLDLNNISIKL